MAISKLKPRHASEGRSIAAALKDRLDYDKNPEKTDGGLLVTGYQCSPDTAWQEFAVSKQIYTATTGRKRAPDQDVISYLIIQSFEPGTITPEDANKLGYKLAMEFTGGEHQFIVATHVDKKHIHNHIEFNSTALDCSHKFNNVKNSFLPLRKANDRICQEFGLNIIEEPQEKGKHYVEWAAEKTGKSWKNLLRKNIDRILPTVKTFDEFLEAMRQEGYEVVQSKKILKFRAQGQERFTRSRILGADYTLEVLQSKLGEFVRDGSFTLQSEEEIVIEQKMFLQQLQAMDSYYVNEHIINLLLEVRGNLRTEKQEMLSAIDRFLSLSPDEKLLFTIGRRLNIFFLLDDLKKPELHKKAEESLKNILGKSPDVDFVALCNYIRQSQI